MLRFGIIAEGVTDQYVIENILLGYFESAEEPAIVAVQPPPGGAGGWGQVFRSLERGDHEGALQFGSDYVVIHIDTDVSQERGFDVPWRDGERELPVEELVARVTERLRSFISPAFYAANHGRILFAVAVHQIECWLLPLLYEDNRSAKSTGCLDAADRELRRRGMRPLASRDKDKRAYDEASAGYRKRKRLLALQDGNPSLKLFLAQLATIDATA